MALENITREHPVISFLHRNIEALPFHDESLSDRIAAYFLQYLEKAGVTLDNAFEIYETFMKDFNNDLKAFSNTNLYPLAAEPERTRPMDRVDYDVVLLLSCLVSPHRYRLIHLLKHQSVAGKNACFVGCGPGLEISLVESQYEAVHAFDISLNPVLNQLLPNAHFYGERFPSPKVSETFDAIYLIEILEHLDDPMALVEHARDALNKDGLLHLTTATNIPQFDHLYNFPSDHSEFEESVKAMGLTVKLNESVEHHYQAAEVHAKNHYLVLTH